MFRKEERKLHKWVRVQIIFVKGADESQITENIQERIREGEKAELLVKQN